MQRHLVPIAVALIACVAQVGCGNLSNDDLLFVAALPDESLRLDPPSESGTSTQGLNEFRTATELAVVAASKINTFTDTVLDHVGDMIVRRPTSRERQKRIWGPVKIRKTGLTARLVMERMTDVACDVATAPLEADVPGYRWTIELNRTTTGEFVAFVSGTSRGADFEHSCGTLDVDVDSAKALALRFDDPRLRGVEAIRLQWQRNGGSAMIDATVEGTTTGDDALAKGLTYRFMRTEGSGGSFSFVIFDAVRLQSTERYQSVLQWKNLGRPWRADFCSTPKGSSSTDCGTSCGPAPARRTYLNVPSGIIGSESECGGLPYRDPMAAMN
jgi:hypothetical protein